MIDRDAFKSLVGKFPSGVTIVTTHDENGEPAGATVSAFSSISMEPPLVMIALGTQGRLTAALRKCSAFAINILREDQQGLALQFARPGDRFAGIEMSACDVRDATDVPVLCDALATLVCRVYGQAIVGDHTVFIGEVIGGRVREGAPLVHCSSRFACVRDIP